MPEATHRAKEINNIAKISCPKHGMSDTYDLFSNNKIKGIGCYRCFRKFPIQEKITKENYK